MPPIKVRAREWLVAGCALLGAASVFTDGTGRPLDGIVLSQGRPVAGATVRIQTDDRFALTDDRGAFSLAAPPAGRHPRFVSAGKPGYYNARVPQPTVDGPITIQLAPIPAVDNARYAWQDPAPNPAQRDNCGNCHDRIFTEWNQDAHARSAINPLVLTMYDGTDMRGRPQVGPGYRLDWNDFGNCASCHAPLSTANNASPSVNLTSVTGVHRTGVSCDFCHKVAEVPAAPNIAGVRVLRPPDAAKLIFGPFDDATFPGDVPDFSPSPLFRSSQYCASCHEAQFWGVSVYGTYSEWRASAYAQQGIECQACHMKSTGAAQLVARLDRGGRVRTPSTIGSHSMMGADRDAFIRDAVRMTVAATRDSARQVVVDVTVANTGAGHSVPTGQPMRNLLLVVTAVGDTGEPAILADGERLPVWAGDYAGQAGQGFAKVLAVTSEYAKFNAMTEEGSTAGDFPSPFWRRNRLVSDTRIASGSSSASHFAFRVPTGSKTVTVTTRLLYRRAFKPLADVKGWKLPDTVVASDVVRVPVKAAPTADEESRP